MAGAESLRAGDENGRVARAQQSFGDAAFDDPREAGTCVRAEDEKVGTVFLDASKDLFDNGALMQAHRRICAEALRRVGRRTEKLFRIVRDVFIDGRVDDDIRRRVAFGGPTNDGGNGELRALIGRETRGEPKRGVGLLRRVDGDEDARENHVTLFRAEKRATDLRLRVP